MSSNDCPSVSENVSRIVLRCTHPKPQMIAQMLRELSETYSWWDPHGSSKTSRTTLRTVRLYQVLQGSTQVADYYLQEMVFPTFLRYQQHKLSVIPSRTLTPSWRG